MSYELSGKIKLIQETQTFSSGFTKREMVVTVEEGNYPQDISLEFLKDKISLLDNLSVGQQVTVSFDIRGREYNGRYFNNLVGWKIQGDSAAVDDGYHQSAPPADQFDSSPFDSMDDDIPF
jgi:hypothetical protein